MPESDFPDCAKRYGVETTLWLIPARILQRDMGPPGSAYTGNVRQVLPSLQTESPVDAVDFSGPVNSRDRRPAEGCRQQPLLNRPENQTRLVE